MPNYPVGPNPGNGAAFNASNSGLLFSGGNQAVVATALSAGVPTTYTGGLVLYNPLASPVNLILQEVRVAFVVAQTNAAVIGLGLGTSGTALAGTLTAVPSFNNNPGSSNTANGLLYSSASIALPVAPYLARIIGAVDTGALTTGVTGSGLALALNGGVLLTPGSFAVILSSAAGTASSLFASFVWVET